MSDEKDLISLINQSENLSKEDEIKCIIVLKPAGNAPIISKNKMKISGSFKVSGLYSYIRSILGKTISENDTLFLYCQSNFSPSLNTYLIDLHKNYAIKDELTIYYALTEVWG